MVEFAGGGGVVDGVGVGVGVAEGGVADAIVEGEAREGERFIAAGRPLRRF